MLTVSELYRNTAVSGLSHVMWDQYNVQNFEMQFYPDQNSILYMVPVGSFTDGRMFHTQILFTDVQFITEEQYNAKQYANVKRMRDNGQAYYFVQHTLYSPIQISCDCENYTYVYAYSNAAVGSHFGPLPQFTVKGTGKPRNPEHVPGMCKHIMNAINGLYGCIDAQLPRY